VTRGRSLGCGLFLFQWRNVFAHLSVQRRFEKSESHGCTGEGNSLEHLLRLQKLDLEIEECKRREKEIPRQKEKHDLQRKRMAEELEERQAICQRLEVEQRKCYGEIEQQQEQIAKYQQQLNTVKKNEEYQALLNEIETTKRQIGQKEERILTLMEELEEAQERLKADEERIDAAVKRIDAHCEALDEELNAAVEKRKQLEAEAEKAAEAVEPDLLRKYRRIRAANISGPAVVPLDDSNDKDPVCTGCYMHVRPQLVNEILAQEVRSCNHCGRLLYYRDHFEEDNANTAEILR